MNYLHRADEWLEAERIRLNNESLRLRHEGHEEIADEYVRRAEDIWNELEIRRAAKLTDSAIQRVTKAIYKFDYKIGKPNIRLVTINGKLV